MSPFLKTSRRLLTVREHGWQDAVLKGLHHLHSHHARPSGRVPVTIQVKLQRIQKDNQFTSAVCNPSNFHSTCSGAEFLCCGSKSCRLSLIRIRIRNADPDPGACKLTKINKYIWFSAFQKSFLPSYRRYVFWPITYLKYIFHLNIQFFMTLSLTRIRILIRMGMQTHADWLLGSGYAMIQKAGSGSALKLMRIHKLEISH